MAVAGFAPAQTPSPVEGLPPARGLFAQARAEAAALPSPLAEWELWAIADDELPGLPDQSLRDYQQLYTAVHGWSLGSDTPLQRTRRFLRYSLEEQAIEAYAKGGKFDTALKWLRDLGPGASVPNEASTWNYVINLMLVQGRLNAVIAAVNACTDQSGQFPFLGAATALSDTKITQPERLAIAREGVQAAASTTDPIGAAGAPTFLAQVHSVFPGMDSAVEDAVQALLRNIAQGSQLTESDAMEARAWNKSGSLAMALLYGIDPDRAQEAQSRFPQFTGMQQSAPTVLHAGSGGGIAGVTAGPGLAQQLAGVGASDPGLALTTAERISDSPTRFQALAAVAQAMAGAHPNRAAQAADSAYQMLDKSMAMTETSATLNLAKAYRRLGQAKRSEEVAAAALDAADQHAEQAEGQFDLSSPEGAAKATDGLTVPADILTYIYKDVASFDPVLALSRARNCRCKVLGPLVLAKVAEGMTPGGAKAPN
ncbi:MAG: hypothetical protein ACRD1M_06140 [Terriglobales bacterium]